LKLVFGGTSQFAVPSLEALVEAGHEVVLILSQPDRPAGRGRELHPGPVKQAAERLGIPVFQPEKLRSPKSVERLLALGEVDAFVVVAYGQKIPRSILEWPKLGVINVHGSLLPKYRGAAPIQRAIMNGESVTGVTTMLLDEGWDTGDTLLQAEVNVLPDETAGELSERLARVGAGLLVRTLTGLRDGLIVPCAQNDSEATFAPSMQREEGFVDWNQPADRIANTIRGCTPSPGAFATLAGSKVKLWRAVPVDCPRTGQPGEVIAATREGIVIACGEGCVGLLELQAESKRRMPAADFARGFGGLVGNVFGALDIDA